MMKRLLKATNIKHLKQGNCYPDPVHTAKVQGTHWSDSANHVEPQPLIANPTLMTSTTLGAGHANQKGGKSPRGYEDLTQLLQVSLVPATRPSFC